MVKRLSAGTCVALLALGLIFGFVPTPASANTAQTAPACFPGSDPDYPPAGNVVQIEASLTLLSGRFTPGGTGVLVLAGASANATYCGTTFSTPITLPAKTADAAGKLTYNIAVPKDFELAAFHHIDVFRAQRQVGSFDFCVDKTGVIGPASGCAKKPASGGKLATTGTNHVFDIVRLGVLALGLGVAALYVRRRMHRTA